MSYESPRVTTKIAGDESGPYLYVEVTHREDFTGGAHVQWRQGDRKGSFEVPGEVARLLVLGAQADKYETLRQKLRELLDE